MDSGRLWAKSWRESSSPPSHVFLPGHLEDVYQAATRVVDCTGKEQLGAVGLDAGGWFERFRRIVLFAAVVHDLGKANDHFQEMITQKRDVQMQPQGLRHEWVTLLMLWQLGEWLRPALQETDSDFAIAAWAVAGHHPAHNHPSPPRFSQPGAGPEIKLLMGHSDFHSALEVLRLKLRLKPSPTCVDIVRKFVGSANVFADLGSWSLASQRSWDAVRNTDERRLVAAVKNCLIAADIAGSALPKALPGDLVCWDWIDKSFSTKPEPGDLRTVVDQRLNGHTPHAFQNDVATSRSRITYVKAGCGSGKTIAAYMWAANNYPTRRLYFCYPTTGTATEGFKDYLFDAGAEVPRIGAKLFHSRRDVDFEIILNTGRDTDRLEATTRLDALESWGTPVVVCTVDTVLGLIQNNRRGLFAWPALAQSAFVFDEIHAFDDRLFGALLRFLRDLPGLPVLLMTASLPAAREQAIRELMESQEQKWAPIAGPEELETRPRYKKGLTSNNDPLPLVRNTLADGGKVLWVCNTVDRVLNAASLIPNAAPLLYHSRFKYEDRVQRHKAVIEAFLGHGPALAICSQVAEMSLDLSADLLVTDAATVPAMIQRLGRLNRRAKDGDSTKPFVVIVPSTHLPYSPADLDASRNWLSKLPDDQITQRDLASCWEQTGDHPPELVASAWLDGGPVTTVTELREASLGITVLMHEDSGRVRATPKLMSRLILPMPRLPRGLNWKEWHSERGVPIAPPGSIAYDPLRGAKWRS